MQVIKRNGAVVPYDYNRIFNAIKAARDDVRPDISDEQIRYVAIAVDNELARLEQISVEEIQDLVEFKLMDFELNDIAKSYIEYRQRHSIRRKAGMHLMDVYKEIFFTDSKDIDFKRENANINANTSMGCMLKLGTEGAKYFVDNYVLSKEFVDAEQEGYVHYHDKDFSLITFNCCQIDLLKVLKGGFNTGHGFLREPNSIRSYAALACIVIQANQNEMFGGQSINAFDFAMAEGVKKSFKKALAEEIQKSLLYASDTRLYPADIQAELEKYPYGYSNPETVNSIMKIINNADLSSKIYVQACINVEEETKQAMEALVHNFNSLHSRAGSQTPFSSINYGLDTSPEGRLVIREVLNAIDAGLGNGETPIFPISVFQIKSGVNYNAGDPNHDLFQLACKVSAKRLYPNFLSIDAPFNLQYYKEGDYNSVVATMGCRTRVMSNVNGPEQSGSRGNFAFVTINLPLLALESRGNINEFFRLFEKYIQISHDYLLSRLKIIEQKKVLNFPFLMGQGIWLDSEKLKPTDSIKDVLKHASYSIGFCGLAECLVALTGKHHGESEDAQKLGLKIIGYLRKRTDEYTEEEQRNWTTFATPAESTAGKFQRINRKKFGVIDGVTDRDYMTNSNHVPVYYPILALDKIKVEAPYHALCNAGHIAYIEMDGDPSKNPEAFEKIVRAMHDADMGYFSINHPVDRDPVCGYTGIIGNVCPKCGRRESDDEIQFERIKRITGYLVGTLDRWNDSKLAEAKDRVSHDIF